MITRGLLAIAVVAIIATSFLSMNFIQSRNNVASTAVVVDLLQEQSGSLQEEANNLKIGLAVAELKLTKTKSWLFTRELQFDSRGDDVEALQRFLAQFPDIYPDGLVTGYFGPLTLGAVERFQEQYDIATSSSPNFGLFGSTTREALLDKMTEVSDEEMEIILSTISTSTTQELVTTAGTTTVPVTATTTSSASTTTPAIPAVLAIPSTGGGGGGSATPTPAPTPTPSPSPSPTPTPT